MNLQGVQKLSNADLLPRLEECIGMVNRAIEQVRNLSLDLRPSILDDLGLVPALRWYARHFSERSAISLELDTPPKMERFDQDTELTLFRIFQECLTNIQRHAKTTHARVRLSGDEQAIEAGRYADAQTTWAAGGCRLAHHMRELAYFLRGRFRNCENLCNQTTVSLLPRSFCLQGDVSR